MEILKETLTYRDQKTHCLVFLPDQKAQHWALMTHGYTSHKGSILNWAARLCDQGMAVALFDLPGHYLGNYSEVVDLEHFITHGHELFKAAYELLASNNTPLEGKLITLGHSLGALFAIKELSLELWKDSMAIAVGLGLLPDNEKHFFLTPLFEKTLVMRSQVVSQALNPEDLFARIIKEKKELSIKKQKIHLISGEDDVVVQGKKGIDSICEILQSYDNEVSVNLCKRLPHHMPEMATPHIYNYLKTNGYFR